MQGTSAREIRWAPVIFIHFTGITGKMPGNANTPKHTLIAKLFTYCDIQTYCDIWANEYWTLLSHGGVTWKKKLISDKRSDYSVRYNDSCERGGICVLLIFKKAPEAYGKSHRLGNCRTVISSLGPIGGFPHGLGQVVSVFCSFLSPLSLCGLVYLYCKFSNTWNYFWDGTTESFLDLIKLQQTKFNGFWFVGCSLLLCNLSSPLSFAYLISSSIFVNNTL